MAHSVVPDGYEVGPARREELGALRAIETAAEALFPPEDLPSELRGDADPVAWFEAHLAARRLWVARLCATSTPVGFAATSVLDGRAHLQEVDVHPDHGRRGLGRCLVCEAIAWARTAGLPCITLTTFRHLAWNGPFYRSLGFSEIPPAAIGSGLADVLSEETANGLDPRTRVAMWLPCNTD